MRRKGLKQLAALLAVLLLAAGVADAQMVSESASVYPPVLSALGADGMSYDDGTIQIKIEADVANQTKIYWVSIKLTDPSQLRTAEAGPRGSQKQAQPTSIAKRANAVLALNGDAYTGHNSGVVYRGGKLIRNVPAYTRDELLIDENGDLTILAFPPKTGRKEIQDAIEAFQQKHEIREAFCFGPGLIINGERQTIKKADDKVSCGFPTRAQRIVFCQTGPLEYLFLVTEGKEQNQPGFTGEELTDLLVQRGGILQAYNLDGGNSTHIILCGEKINAKEYKSRNIWDMIVFNSLVPPEGR